MAYETRSQTKLKLNEGSDITTEMDKNYQHSAPQEHHYPPVKNDAELIQKCNASKNVVVGKTCSENNSLIIPMLIVLASTMIVKSYLSVYEDSSSSEEMEVDILDLKIEKLADRYKNLHDDVWSILTYCLKSTLDVEKPCIIVLLNREEESFNNLLHDIGDLSVELLKPSSSNKYFLKGSTVTNSIENYSFDHLKSKLSENKVMLIDEMEKVPLEIMQSFHSLCDVYDPAVKQAVIVFLLNHKHIKVDLEVNDATLANNILFQVWKDFIHPDLINPLVIRVTENVINLQRTKVYPY